MRVLVTGWASFHDGEATVGDVVSLRSVSAALRHRGVDHTVAWSPGYEPTGPRLDALDAADFTHLVFACGPCHGRQVERLHERFADCRRLAVGVSVMDWDDPAVRGFDAVFPRDASGAGLERGPNADLSFAPELHCVPVVAVMLAPGQPEYGPRRRHADVHGALAEWLSTVRCAPLVLDTRLDSRADFACAEPEQFFSLLQHADAAVTTRLHGLVMALRAGIPAMAVDPVDGGAKITAQARALHWPAVLSAEDAADAARLDSCWKWCRSWEARAQAARSATSGRLGAERILDALCAEIGSAVVVGR